MRVLRAQRHTGCASRVIPHLVGRRLRGMVPRAGSLASIQPRTSPNTSNYQISMIFVFLISTKARMKPHSNRISARDTAEQRGYQVGAG